MLTLLFFKASWCKPCQSMVETVNKLEDIIVQEIDIDDNPQLRADYMVRVVPTFIVVKDRNEVARKTGQTPLSEMREFVDECRRV